MPEITSVEAPNRLKRARSPASGCGTAESCADHAINSDLDQPPHAKRASCTAQSELPVTIAYNDGMHDPHVQEPAQVGPLTRYGGVEEEDNSWWCSHEDDEPEASTNSRPWLDADESAILELMNNLEQTIRSTDHEGEHAEDSACSSSNSPLKPYTSSAAESSCRLGERSEEDDRLENRVASESGGDQGAEAAIDEEIDQLLQEAEDRSFLANLCDSGHENVIASSPAEPWELYDEELGDTMDYNPMLDPNFECFDFGCF